MPETLRQRIIQEEAFARVLSQRSLPYLRLLNLLMQGEASKWVKRHYHELVVQSHDVETFLDDYDARNNRTFACLTELIASLRGLGKVAISLKHLVVRFPRYQVAMSAEESDRFFADTEETTRFLLASIETVIRAVLAEFVNVGVVVTSEATPDSSVSDDGPREFLPHDIDEEDILDEEQKIAEIATRYLETTSVVMEASERVQAAAARTGDDRPRLEVLKDIVLRSLDEERCRDLEARVHSVQSKYDTYVRATTIESRTPALAALRGHVSLSLHLLEMSTELVHFYVRHENDVRYERAKAHVAGLVDKAMVLDRTLNYSVYYAARSLAVGLPAAEEILSAFVRTSDLSVTIPDGSTLHARPMSLIAKVVAEHGTMVEMEIESEIANAGSIMELIVLVGSHPDARTVTFRGDERPLNDLRVLFESGLGEQGLDKLPASLGYLR